MQRQKGRPFVIWRWHVLTNSIEAYAYSVVLIVIATLLRWALGQFGQNVEPFPTYFPAVLLATAIGGAGPGILVALSGGVIGWLAFMAPHGESVLGSHGQEISLVAYFCASLLILWGVQQYRRVTQQLEDEEEFRKLAVEELSHRLKNKIATIQSIVSFQLRDRPQIRDAIVDRLIALSATDDLILEAQGQGARLRDILSAELGPYEASRIAVDGPAIILSPKLALTIALLVHELATNAAKYGALSRASGQIFICWSLANGCLSLEWCESGGPVVTPPTKSGFGTSLLSRALAPFGGTIAIAYEPTGMVCKLSVELPQDIRLFEPDVMAIGKGPTKYRLNEGVQTRRGANAQLRSNGFKLDEKPSRWPRVSLSASRPFVGGHQADAAKQAARRGSGQ